MKFLDGLSGSVGNSFVAEDRGVLVTLGTFYDWFYADKLRSFFVRPELVLGPITGLRPVEPILAGSHDKIVL